MEAIFVVDSQLTYKTGTPDQSTLRVKAGDRAQIMKMPIVCALETDEHGRMTGCQATAKISVKGCIYPIEVPLNILRIEKTEG